MMSMPKTLHTHYVQGYLVLGVLVVFYHNR